MVASACMQVEYTSHDMGNPVRFGQDFIGKVANPKDILQFYKKRGGATRECRSLSFRTELGAQNSITCSVQAKTSRTRLSTSSTQI